MREVRNGVQVVCVYYGHPGVFAHPTRRAIAIATSEGYVARMLPGISAEDSLFADLLVNPSFPGSQTVDASDLVYRARPLATSCHVIIFQAAVFGRWKNNFTAFEVGSLPLVQTLFILIIVIFCKSRMTSLTILSIDCKTIMDRTIP